MISGSVISRRDWIIAYFHTVVFHTGKTVSIINNSTQYTFEEKEVLNSYSLCW